MILGGSHTIRPGSFAVSALVAVAIAPPPVLLLITNLPLASTGSALHCASLVAAVTTTVGAEAPGARFPKLQDSKFGEVNVQVGGAVMGADSVHVKPVGSVSVSTTFLAVPVPVLLTTMVKVAASPR